jgi:hypothetical protein
LQMLGMTQTGNKKKSYIYQQQIEDYKLNWLDRNVWWMAMGNLTYQIVVCVVCLGELDGIALVMESIWSVDALVVEM